MKTIQYNAQDIDAYKLLVKIYIREGEIEEAITLLETRLDKEENGDLYYVLSQVYKHVDKMVEYVNSLKKAFENSLTLTFSKDIVKKEYDYYSKKNIEEETEEDIDEDFEEEIE